MAFTAADVPKYRDAARREANPTEESGVFIESSSFLATLCAKTEASNLTAQQPTPASNLVASFESAVSEVRLAASVEGQGYLAIERIIAAHEEIGNAVTLYLQSVAASTRQPIVTGNVRKELLQAKESGELSTRTYNALRIIASISQTGVAHKDIERVFSSRGPITCLKDYEKFTQEDLLSAKNLGKTSLIEALGFFAKKGVSIKP